jgi:DNA-binding GntR family transcriptional regulator
MAEKCLTRYIDRGARRDGGEDGVMVQDGYGRPGPEESNQPNLRHLRARLALAVVMTTSDPVPFDLNLAREAFATAAGLHGAATRRAAPRLRPADFRKLRVLDAEFADALQDGRVHAAIAADDAFHRVFLDAAGDPDLAVSVELMIPRLRRMDLWLFTRESFDAGANTHGATLSALEAGDVDRAVALVEASYTDAGEALAAIVERPPAAAY